MSGVRWIRGGRLRWCQSRAPKSKETLDESRKWTWDRRISLGTVTIRPLNYRCPFRTSNRITRPAESFSKEIMESKESKRRGHRERTRT